MKKHSGDDSLIYGIVYGDKKYENAKRLNEWTAINKGKVDKVFSFGPEDIDKDFYEENKSILDEKRGNGYWLWKPYFIQRILNETKEGDYLCYSDAGSAYYAPVIDMKNALEKTGQEVMCYQIGVAEKEWTKRDAFILLDCDSAEYTDSYQRSATHIFMKNTPDTKKLVAEWLNYAKDRRLITNDPNELGKENYEGFKEHRHDQSLWSLITKKYNIEPFRDPGTTPKKNDSEVYKRSTYPRTFVDHRNGKISTWHQVKRAACFIYLFNHFKFIRTLYSLYGKTYRLYAKIIKR